MKHIFTLEFLVNAILYTLGVGCILGMIWLIGFMFLHNPDAEPKPKAKPRQSFRMSYGDESPNEVARMNRRAGR
jgi:hypothetical protein